MIPNEDSTTRHAERVRPEQLRTLAEQRVGAGVSTVPVWGKACLTPWKPYIAQLPAPDDLARLFMPNGQGAPTGLAMVLGPTTWAKWPYLWILEIEARNGAESEPWLYANYPKWREGNVAESGGGGPHIYLLADAPVATRRFAWGKIRGAGSLTVMPPSRHPAGGQYRWLAQQATLRANPNTLDLPGDDGSERPTYTNLADGPIRERVVNCERADRRSLSGK